MFEWVGLSSTALWWIAFASMAMVVLVLIAAPWLIIRIPADYFAYTHRSGVHHPSKRHWFRWIWLIAKNVIGVSFLFLGVLMLVLPGQGILTILVGVTLLDFPGKFRFQRWIVNRRGVLGSVNWIRRKAGKQALILEQ
mgnify:CR=1 FL=1